jgi:hypothetical protein
MMPTTENAMNIIIQDDHAEERREVKSAWDDKFDPHYGRPVDQAIDGRNSFAQLRNDMNDRRRQTARRMEGASRYCY